MNKMLTVYNADGTELRKVKNLGWVLRHGRLVDCFIFRRGKGNPGDDGELEIVFRSGLSCKTSFADFRVMVGFLRRPMWYGLTLNITDHDNTGRSVVISKYGSMR